MQCPDLSRGGLCPAVGSIMRVSSVVSKNYQENCVFFDFIEQVIGKLSEIGSAQAAGVEMVASRISLHRGHHGIQLTPKSRGNSLRNFRVMPGGFTNIIGKFRVSDEPHRL